MFNLEEYRRKRQSIIEQALDKALPTEETIPQELHRAMRYVVFTGGKRIRPFLTIAAAESVGATINDALSAAVAVELFHTYTLVHDDLPAMDDDELRRGKPTAHVVFGEANAILAGDALQALAFEVLCQQEKAAALIQELAHAGGSQGVVGGQWVDVASEDQSVGEDIITFIHENKTAALIRAAVRMGAMCGQATSEQLDHLTNYGTAIGHAFQLIDDLLDEGTEEGKATAVSLYGPEKTRQRAQEKIAQACDAVAVLPSPEPLQAIANLIVERTH